MHILPSSCSLWSVFMVNLWLRFRFRTRLQHERLTAKH